MGNVCWAKNTWNGQQTHLYEWPLLLFGPGGGTRLSGDPMSPDSTEERQHSESVADWRKTKRCHTHTPHTRLTSLTHTRHSEGPESCSLYKEMQSGLGDMCYMVTLHKEIE